MGVRNLQVRQTTHRHHQEGGDGNYQLVGEVELDVLVVVGLDVLGVGSAEVGLVVVLAEGSLVLLELLVVLVLLVVFLGAVVVLVPHQQLQMIRPIVVGVNYQQVAEVGLVLADLVVVKLVWMELVAMVVELLVG